MKASTIWLNDYLDPPATAQEQGELLTMAGFPVEACDAIDLPNGSSDVCTEYEMTSNRGDCICHLGLARELAAITGRTFKPPATTHPSTAGRAADSVRVTNREPERCPLYTARVIRGVNVGPSPDWLANRLRAIGQIPRNNIVDATNFVLFEYGQPTHVFDLARINGAEIVIRVAEPDEPFLPIGEGEQTVKLTPDDLVIADGNAAIAIGGVKGGALSAVTEQTTDILIEAATFNPVTVRNSSRRHGIQSDSSYRYERGVHPAHIEPAAERLVQLILELAGGTLEEGVVFDGPPIPPLQSATMRTDRCRKLLGVDIDDATMLDDLDRLGFCPAMADGIITCTVPAHRMDITREVDLIEEVSRMYGHANIPTAATIDLRVSPPQGLIEGRRALTQTLVGMGFVETVTHSLLAPQEAAPFFANGESPLRVDKDRVAENVLRPAVIASVLHVRAFNRDRGTGSLRLFEYASSFARTGGEQHRESRTLALLMDATDNSLGLRPLRGVVERLARIVGGPDTLVDLRPTADIPWLESNAQAEVRLNGEPIGWIGLLAQSIRGHFDLEEMELMASEINLEAALAAYPPEIDVHAPPRFPAIERDVSVIVDEHITWGAVSRVIQSLNLDMLDAIEFITTYRGKQVGAEKKSLTLRLRFRADDRTLRHEEVDPQVEATVRALGTELDARIRQ